MKRPVLAASGALFCVGWGGNQFTPLLSLYRHDEGWSTTTVDLLLAAYLVGLLPGLLVGGPLSDRHGRRRLVVLATLVSGVASGVLALGTLGIAAIALGRALSGVAVGIGMAVATSWVKELSDAGSRPGSGARRAALSLTGGFGIGAGVAGVLAQWGPWPEVLPYTAAIAVAVVALVLLLTQTTPTVGNPQGYAPVSFRQLVGGKRFRWVVLPMAPWIFSSAAIAYAVVPQLEVGRTGTHQLLYATGLTVVTLATGALIQPVARRLDDDSTSRAVVVSMLLMTAGMAVAAVEASERSLLLGFGIAVLLGAAYGTAIVSGLLEVQRIAGPDELAGLTGVYYSLAYLGFLLPAILSALTHLAPITALLWGVAGLALASTAVTARGWSRHLPVTPVTPGCAVTTSGG